MTDNLPISEIDFSTIKQNLKNYLKDQAEFSDHNFEGSALSMLLDILAYNTHIMAAHTNLAFGETFLDSAVLRGSVVSRAKELGYLPRSATAAKATITISFSVTGNPAQYTIPKGTKFTASSTGTSYTFVTTHDCIVENDGNDVFSKSVDIYQGKFATYTYTVNLNDASQKFTIPSKDADTQFLTVLFKANSGVADYSPWSNSNTISIGDLDSTTEVFFLKESYDEFFEVYFGDGIIGKALTNGNLVQLSYLITDGPDANNARTFSLASSLSGVSGVSIVTVSNSASGAEKETVESIKYLAPFYYASQGRAVTEDDYISLIKSNYSQVDDVAVWGGERNDPPYYGKVFIAIKPTTDLLLTATEKEAIQNDIINRFNVVSIRPEIVDPDYISVAVKVVVTYNSRLYDPNSDIDLDALVSEAVEDYFDLQANKFGQPLYYSKLVRAIDDSSTLILNNIVNLKLEKSVEIFSGISGTYDFNFNNSLHPGSVVSNTLVMNGLEWNIKDIPEGDSPQVTGNLAIYRVNDQGTTVYLTQAAGTINYNTGEISVVNQKITTISEDPIFKRLTISVAPGTFVDVNNPEVIYVDQNIYTNERNQIITLKDAGISITLLPDES